MSETTERLRRVIEKIKQPRFLIFTGLAGILLIFASSLLPQKSTAAPTVGENYPAAEEYREQLEKDALTLVRKISGDSGAAVVVTLESGVRYSYADVTESDSESAAGAEGEQESKSLSRSYLTVKGADGSEKALLVTQLMPEVRGVAVVCRNGDEEQIAEKLRHALMAAFNLTSKRVSIQGGNGYEKR